MKKFDKYQKNVTFINGDCFKELDNFDDKSIDCVITSPPYFREREKNKHFNLNQTIEQYLDSILEFSNKIYRILKDEGSFWLNIGDAYSSGSLMLIPFLVANKLKEAGWILNNDIIWSKNSYTPTSYSKRLSNSYEHFFHFVKTKEFYYNLTALDSKRNISKVINEKVISSTGVSGKNYKKIIKSSNVLTEEEKNNALNELEITLNKIQSGEIYDFRMIIKGHNKIVSKNRGLEVEKHGFVIIESKYNRPSDIWEIDTEKKGIHYAPFPEDLVEFPIKVTCPLNGIILDPFCGSGTVNFVALQNNKQSIGIELKDEFLTFAKNRCNQ